VHGLCQTEHRVRNRFGCTRWYSKLMRLKWKLILVHLEIVLILKQDRCMVCVECTISLEIILDAPNGTPRWVMSNLVSVRLDMVLMSKQDRCTVCAKHTIGSIIVFDTPDGTSR
jgi:hypothetical protein